MPGLWKVNLEKVADLTGEEADAIIGHSEFVEDSAEMFLAVDFCDDDEDMREAIEDLRRSVRPEVFEVLKKLKEGDDTFMIG